MATNPSANDVFDEEIKVSTDFVKCENCGSNMVFDPETQSLTCEHCGTKIDFEKDKQVKEIAIENAFSVAEKWDDTKVMRCDNCGALISISRSEVSIVCPYCNTPLVKLNEEISGIKPNAVYPFTLSKDEAVKDAKKWARSRLFSPSKFKKNLVEKNLKGVYQPCFTFDSQTVTAYNGRLGKRKTRTVHTKNGTRTETYIVWYNVQGNISYNFDDITISASAQIEQKKLNKLMPFRVQTLAVYEKKYLAGFVANHYDKDIKTSWNEAKAIMDKRIRDAILEKHNCDVVDYLNTSTTHNNVTYKYVLLPIYMLNYRYKQKNYAVSVNGNTGKTTGKAPVSILRVLAAVVIGVAVLVGAYFLYKNTAGSDTAQITQFVSTAINNEISL